MNLALSVQEATSQDPADVPRIRRWDSRDVVAILTCAVLLIDSHLWPERLLSGAAMACVFTSRSLRRSHRFWLTLVALWTPFLLFRWYQHEDHIYLAVYWAAAVGLSFWGSNQKTTLLVNARLLIGLTFAFAFFWKVWSPEFYSNELMHYKLLFDYRFREGITQPFTGMTAAQAAHNLEAITSLRNLGATKTTAGLQYPEQLGVVAWFMTWWTIIVEGILAVLFLAPWHNAFVRNLRNVGLMFFALSLYLIVPVLGFGNLFMVMGAAQCRPDERKMRGAFVVASMLFMIMFAIRF
ncbi:MAG: hypothetical protein KDA87_10475 [Planctomycetales bacterium]|nr:hypothetical protein [Planctomycetales bacterium]